MDKILSELKDAEYRIAEVKKGERSKKAPLPFTTSTLQQEASKVLNFSTQKTMRLAQQLYEGVDVKGSGTIGIITYLRTDSTRISEEADYAARTTLHQNSERNIWQQQRKRMTAKENSGCSRGNPSHRYQPYTLILKGVSFPRPVSFISADMETFCSKQNAAGKI